MCALGMCAALAVRPERSTSRAAPREARPEALSLRGTFSRLLRGKSRQFLSGPRRDCRASVRLPSAGLFRKVTLSDLCAESDWRVWRAARNASSVNGGRLPYSLGTVASAARPRQLNTARQTSLGRFRPLASISQEVLTRKEGTMPRAPCPLCAASIPPHLTRSDDIEGEKRASIRRRSRTLSGSCERTSGQKKRDGAPSAFSLSNRASRAAGSGHTADDPISIDVANSAEDSIKNVIANPLAVSGHGLHAWGSTQRRQQ